MGAGSISARYAPRDDRPRGQDRGRWTDSAAVRRRLPDWRVRLTPLVAGALLSLVAPSCRAVELPGQAGHFQRASSARAIGYRAGHSEMPGRDPRSLIQQVRFNQKAVSFDPAVTVGPEAGVLDIQLAPPAPGGFDRLRYRMLGIDTGWKEAGKERDLLYNHLAPGHYEFDYQQAETGGLRGSVVESIPVTVIAPYWQTANFHNLCIFLLLLMVLILYKLRVGLLVKRARKLQETVSQARAELTLTARIADDAQEALKEQALRDSLTGLWNRGAIFAMLEREVCRAQRDRCPITLIMIDLDHFKRINDTYGHPAGDEVLREAANRLFEVMRPYDFAGRYGGEEFLVVLPSCSPPNGVQRAEDFRRAMAEKPFGTAAGPLAITCSLGVAAFDYPMPPEDLIQRADEALYRAKRKGRNCVCAGAIEGDGGSTLVGQLTGRG